MRGFWRWLRRGLLALAALVVALVAPVIYVETACMPDEEVRSTTTLVPEEFVRPEARTLMTYPEWHIVHAYDDYAAVIAEGDPHDYAYLRSIRDYWRSLCALSRASASLGGVDAGTRQMVYVIGSSFTLELALKAVYEETVGRVATLVRGEARASLDDLSATQARNYATFLQQVPWYRWDFAGDAQALSNERGEGFRETERALALGLEYRAKAAYAEVIEQAVANVGPDALRLRMVLTGLAADRLAGLEGVAVIGPAGEGLEIETPRYRALTRLLADFAEDGAEFREIAGNDEILLTVLSNVPVLPDALHSFARQGHGDHRHLLFVKVADLAETLRGLADRGLTLEHIHDY